MSAVAALLELRARGVAVDAAGDRVRCRHRPGALPADLADRVRARRGEVLADPDALRAAAAEAVFDAAPDEAAQPAGGVPPADRCRACGAARAAPVPVCPVCHPTARIGVGPGRDHRQPELDGRPTDGGPQP